MQASNVHFTSKQHLQAVQLTIAGILKPMTFMHSEIVVHEGQHCHEMYIVVHGTVQVLELAAEGAGMLMRLVRG